MITKSELIQAIKLYVSYGIDTITEDTATNFIQASNKANKTNLETKKIINLEEETEASKIRPEKPKHEFGTFNKAKEEYFTDLFESKKKEPEILQATIEAEQQAQEIADTSNTLEELKERTEASTFCALKKYAKNFVFGEGIEKEPIAMIIGEAPGADEDIQGRPFVGVSGQLLTKALETIRLSREKNFYITNIIKWRPPGNRPPTREEIKICMPIVKKQIELIKPKMIILIGAVSATGLLETTEGITKIRGQIFDYKGLKTIATFHPSYLLRNPTAKKQTYIDMLKIKEIINEIAI